MSGFKRKLAENLRHPKGLFGWFIGQFMNHFNKGIIQQTINLLPTSRNQKVVEIGFGSGKALQLASRELVDAHFYGFDISEKMIKSARRRNRKLMRDGRLKLELASISAIPLKDDFIDTIYTINTIYFWKNLDKGCQEVNRILKKDGLFIISFNPKENMNEAVYPSDLFQFLSSDEVIDLMERNGFEKVSLDFMNDRYEKYASLVVRKL
jgi:ubiquinone/menaquinone biosynthesis C-methylase UbiE